MISPAGICRLHPHRYSCSPFYPEITLDELFYIVIDFPQW